MSAPNLYKTCFCKKYIQSQYKCLNLHFRRWRDELIAFITFVGLFGKQLTSKRELACDSCQFVSVTLAW